MYYLLFFVAFVYELHNTTNHSGGERRYQQKKGALKIFFVCFESALCSVTKKKGGIIMVHNTYRRDKMDVPVRHLPTSPFGLL